MQIGGQLNMEALFKILKSKIEQSDLNISNFDVLSKIIENILKHKQQKPDLIKEIKMNDEEFNQIELVLRKACVESQIFKGKSKAMKEVVLKFSQLRDLIVKNEKQE